MGWFGQSQNSLGTLYPRDATSKNFRWGLIGRGRTNIAPKLQFTYFREDIGITGSLDRDENVRNRMRCSGNTEPLFLNLLRSQGIDSQPAGRYDNPIFCTGPPGNIGWRHRFLGIDSWTP